jgi:hypothetical protein
MRITEEEALKAAALISNYCKERESSCRGCMFDIGTMCFVAWEPNYWNEYIEKVKAKREGDDA